MTEWLPEYVQKKMAELVAASPQLRASLEDAGGVLLYSNVGIESYLRPDGTVWMHHAPDWTNRPDHYEWREARGNERWAALVVGTRRMPELKRLLPRRPSHAVSCSRCGGAGFLLGGLVCEACGALGWNAEGAA